MGTKEGIEIIMYSLQESIRSIMQHPTATASEKKKHITHFLQYMGEYSENADELGEAQTTAMEMLEILTDQIAFEQRLGKIKPLSIPKKRSEEAKQLREWKKKHLPTNVYGIIQPKGESEAMTYDELNRVLEFLLMFNILTIFQVQEIRAKALPYCK